MSHLHENNQALSQLFKIVARPVPMQEMLGACLDALLDLSWLSLLPRAGIFLTDTDASGTPTLKLVAQRNLCVEILTRCANVRWGECLCGRAAQTRQPVYAACMDERHEITFDGIQPHGHYNIPILSGEQVLGVLVFYLPAGAKYNQQEVDFLIQCVGVLALAIELRSKEQELNAKNRELSFQKKTLDAHAIVSISDTRGNITYANDKLCEISGYSQQELLGQNHRILNSGGHPEQYYADLWQTITSGKTWHGEFRNRSKNGDFYWVEATIQPFLDQSGKPFQYVAVSTDITKLKRIESSLKMAQSVANIGSWSLDLITGQLHWSDEIFRIFGIDPQHFGASLNAFLDTIHPDDLDYVNKNYQDSLAGKHPYDIEHRIVRKDNGETRWVHERCIHQLSESGEVIRSDGTVQDITERKLAQQEVQRLAMTDPLTGLANRTQFHARFDEYLKLARREKLSLALLFIDLDRFKPVNDSYGHQTGDALLQEVARILTHERRETDIVARLGGDEFAILLLSSSHQQTGTNIAARIIAEIEQPITINGHDIQIGASIGIATSPQHGDDQDMLIHKADTALYQAKHAGRNRYCIYSAPLAGQS
ncbi:MAG: diguanylate cyclase [Gallionella sp.]|nr:diguanylate cyclase [Gallionella sp.]MDD4946333.1 diguanylate cyclase [Gallionella sp.]